MTLKDLMTNSTVGYSSNSWVSCLYIRLVEQRVYSQSKWLEFGLYVTS